MRAKLHGMGDHLVTARHLVPLFPDSSRHRYTDGQAFTPSPFTPLPAHHPITTHTSGPSRTLPSALPPLTHSLLPLHS
ncbi:hypothetical protein E2C01_041859 [Portunus trituberculatus]|uniref:Uncharacterized protein n=1 Tax=Portunus trituberculatus TaxID=210409 RepID=A0A5B7FUV6_PORTR|nr:hypothetical protein [Portunus trituberculatus]